MPISPLVCCDFYKVDHRRQYPAKTQLVVSNFTPRSGKHANIGEKDGIIFSGMQYAIKDFLQRIWNDGFFRQNKEKMLQNYKRRLDTSLGKDAVPIEHIGELHDLGYLPIEIKALPEGSFVPVGVPCFTIHNTKSEFFWLTNYLETILSAYLWQPCTTATTARAYHKLFDKFAAKTGSPEDFTDVQGHDFSFRGMSSLQTALVSGQAHLLSFKGTDTVGAIDFLEQYYNADASRELIGCSVPATEHSVMSMGGGKSFEELGTFKRLITELYPKGIVSIVSDTWDFWNVMTRYTIALKDEIMARDGKVVFRPDSGEPVNIICGDPSARVDTPEYKGAVEILWEIFGGTVTEKGYKLLDPHVGLIYGDSITYERAEKILTLLEEKGFASANIVFGIGSYTYQHVTRDTWSFAMKATYGVVDGVPREIFKAPKTDNGEKVSAKGLLFVDKNSKGTYALLQGVSWAEFMSPENCLQTVFKDGKLIKETSLSEIRERVKCS